MANHSKIPTLKFKFQVVLKALKSEENRERT